MKKLSSPINIKGRYPNHPTHILWTTRIAPVIVFIMTKVVIALVHNNGHFIFLQRHNGAWTFPSGKIEDGEEPTDACVREVAEETGVHVAVKSFLGQREAENAQLLYYLCDDVSGQLDITEPDKFHTVDWKKPDEIQKLAGNTLFEPVKAHLKRAANIDDRYNPRP